MSNNEINQEPAENEGLAYAWALYRTWAISSRGIKATISKWRKRVFAFATLGALLGILSDTLGSIGIPWLSESLALGSALCISIASYAASEVLTGDKEKLWIRARSAAETFKSESYLYLLRVAPYNRGNPDKKLFSRLEGIIQNLGDLEANVISKEEERKRMPSPCFGVQDYVKERIEDQIYKYYLPKAAEYQGILKKSRNWSFFLGFAGVMLGTFGAAGWSEYTAVWIAFASTVSASIASYISANRYQYMVVSYAATANKLRMLLARWQRLDQDDPKETQRFIKSCEDLISIENSAWMTEISDNSDLTSS